MNQTKQKRIVLLCMLALCACSTALPPASVPVAVACAKLSPAPADVMVEREPNFRERLLNFFSISSTNAMQLPDSLGQGSK